MRFRISSFCSSWRDRFSSAIADCCFTTDPALWPVARIRPDQNSNLSRNDCDDADAKVQLHDNVSCSLTVESERSTKYCLNVVFLAWGLARATCSTTFRWASLATHRHNGAHLSEVDALLPSLATLPPDVCHRQETKLSPFARKHSTCSKTLILQAHRPFTSATSIENIGHNLSLDMAVLGTRSTACLTPRGATTLIYLFAKLDECPSKPRGLINVFVPRSKNEVTCYLHEEEGDQNKT